MVHYYEVHVTVEPVEEEGVDTFAEFSDRMSDDSWKVSKFDADDLDHADKAWFLSARFDGPDWARKETLRCVLLLQEAGYTVTRWKIEMATKDSKHGDLLSSLI